MRLYAEPIECQQFERNAQSDPLLSRGQSPEHDGPRGGQLPALGHVGSPLGLGPGLAPLASGWDSSTRRRSGESPNLRAVLSACPASGGPPDIQSPAGWTPRWTWPAALPGGRGARRPDETGQGGLFDSGTLANRYR